MPFKLTLSKEGRVLETFHYEDGQERVLIGRNEDCDVQIEGNSVSRHHCEILLDDGFHRLCDLSSSTGTFVNGRRVIEASLDIGDTLTVGDYLIDYSANLPKAKKPKLRRQDGQQMTVEMPEDGVAPAHGVRASAKPQGHLSVVDAAGVKRNMLLQTSTFLIGSVENADLRIAPGWRRPRVAALVLRDRYGFRILDTSPKGNGLTINGKQVRDAELKNGDQVLVWDQRIVFRKGLPRLEEGDLRRETEWLRPK